PRRVQPGAARARAAVAARAPRPARPRARPAPPAVARPRALARARGRASVAESGDRPALLRGDRMCYRTPGRSRYRVGMALATPVPAEGPTDGGDDLLVDSTLPAAEAELLAPVLTAFLRRHPGDDTAMIVR